MRSRRVETQLPHSHLPILTHVVVEHSSRRRFSGWTAGLCGQTKDDDNAGPNLKMLMLQQACTANVYSGSGVPVSSAHYTRHCRTAIANDCPVRRIVNQVTSKKMPGATQRSTPGSTCNDIDSRDPDQECEANLSQAMLSPAVQLLRSSLW